MLESELFQAWLIYCFSFWYKRRCLVNFIRSFNLKRSGSSKTFLNNLKKWFVFLHISINHSSMDKKIVIIGAGASGVAAATKLVSNGFQQLTILEGGDRIGGRIHTIPFGANVVDMGAEKFVFFYSPLRIDFFYFRNHLYMYRT